ncbi:MAG: tyrosine-type recombinase/integrase [Flavobacteriales bacterium]|nr:tyrosine-type recombinase/integrase [Flavobacteriales bacterium]MCB9186433.1 tyrosine-type recombinase/integrase [Flavobacteriales bacterium]
MTKPTTTSYIEWNQMLGLCERLKSDGLYREYLLILTGCHFGLRISDLLSLRWCDVIEKSQVTIIERKTNKKRVIAIHDRVKDALAVCKPHFEKQRHWTLQSPLFANRWGDAISVSYVNKRLKYVFVIYRVKTDKASSHVLRKSFGRHLWSVYNESEKALIFLSEIFGHSNTAVTRRYLGITQEEISDAYLSL